MNQTQNYNLNLAEGTDKYNHLTLDNPNYVAIDAQMKVNETNSVPSATELKTGTVHAITRSKPDASMFRFTATSNWVTGDSVTVDNTEVTALLPSGRTLASGCYVIGAEVLCVLVGQRLTVFVESAQTVAEDSEKLGGQIPNYYATKSEVQIAQNTAEAAGTVSEQNTQSIGVLDGRLNTLLEGAMNISSGGVASKTYVDIPVTFDNDYDRPPLVLVSMVSTSTAVGMGDVSVVPIQVTTTGFTCRIFNNDTSGRSPAFNWIAVRV